LTAAAAQNARRLFSHMSLPNSVRNKNAVQDKNVQNALTECPRKKPSIKMLIVVVKSIRYKPPLSVRYCVQEEQT